jgi:hypothetical protein
MSIIVLKVFKSLGISPGIECLFNEKDLNVEARSLIMLMNLCELENMIQISTMSSMCHNLV